jgi:hypothetical protein
MTEVFRMGRPKGRFTVAKSFTLDVQTAAWLARECRERKIKASALLGEIIERDRIREKEKKESTLKEAPTRLCVGCLEKTERTPELLCTKCGREDTVLIEMLKRQS